MIQIQDHQTFNRHIYICKKDFALIQKQSIESFITNGP